MITCKEKSWLFGAVRYESVGCMSIMLFCGLPVYSRIGASWSLFGGLFTRIYRT